MRRVEIFENRDLVYVIKHINVPGVYKVGMTKNLKNRVNNLNSASPYGIEVVYVEYTECTGLIECSIHEKWKLNRVNGEWFALDEYDLNLLVSDLKVMGRIVNDCGGIYSEAKKGIEKSGYIPVINANYSFKKKRMLDIDWVSADKRVKNPY